MPKKVIIGINGILAYDGELFAVKCPVCDKTYPKRRLKGLSPKLRGYPCPVCRRSLYHIAHKDKIREQRRALYQKNPEKYRAMNKKWASAHKDQRNQIHKKWRDENREHLKKYRKSRRRLLNARHRAWYHKHADVLREKARIRYQTKKREKELLAVVPEPGIMPDIVDAD